MSDLIEPTLRCGGRLRRQGQLAPALRRSSLWKFFVAALALWLTGCTTAGRPVVSQSALPPSTCANSSFPSESSSPTTTGPSPVTESSSTPQAAAPARISGFNSYIEVQNCDYPGPNSFGEATLRFKTAAGVRCEIRDVANSPGDLWSTVQCWGPLPGVPEGVSLVTLESAYVPKYGHVTGADEINERGVYLFMEPSKYRELEPGHKIVVPGGKPGEPDKNNVVCAVGQDHVLTCEIQHSEYGDTTHGFRLSTAGSAVY